jgi:hypothetical protein
MYAIDCLANPKHPKSNFFAIWLFVALSFLVAWFMASCATVDRCNKLHPPIIHDSIITCIQDTTIYKHDTTYQDGEVVWVQKHDTVFKTIDRIRTIRDTIIQERIKTVTDDRTKTSPPITIINKYWYDTFSDWWFVISLILIILLMGWAWLTKKIPF